jgi:hypothetical protein
MDANNCREYAKRCIEMANSAANTERQSMMFEIAAAWNQLAVELDANEALRAQMQRIQVLPDIGRP